MGKVENIEHTEARFGNAAVVLAVAPEAAAELVEPGTAGGWPQSAELMEGNRIPVVWLSLKEPAERVALMEPGDVEHGQGSVLEVGFELEVEVAQLEQEGQAVVLVVGKGEGHGFEIEWLAGMERAAALCPPAQLLTEHPLLSAFGALQVGSGSPQFPAYHAKSAHLLEPHAVCSQIASVFHQYSHCCYQLSTSAHQQNSRDGMFCPPTVKALSLHFQVHAEDYQHISSWYDQYPL